jgi:putative acetyltransferase
MVKLRNATVEDADPIRNLFRETIMSVNTKDYNEEQVAIWAKGSEDRNAWESKITGQNFIVAESDKGIVGFASVTEEGYIDFMFTHKDHQSKGIASNMLLKLEEFAIAAKLDRVWAEVSITARPFFLRKGFEITERFFREVSGVTFDDCVMTKYLNRKKIMKANEL